jgi:hypothetical protein
MAWACLSVGYQVDLPGQQTCTCLCLRCCLLTNLLLTLTLRRCAQLGFLCTDPFASSSEASELGQDGVLLTSPQRQYISGLHWLPEGGGASRLVTSSYDGSIVVCDPAAEQFRVLQDIDGEDLSSLGCRDSTCLLTGDSLVRCGLPLQCSLLQTSHVVSVRTSLACLSHATVL